MIPPCQRCGNPGPALVEVNTADLGPLYWWCLICGEKWPIHAKAENPGLYAAALAAIYQAGPL